MSDDKTVNDPERYARCARVHPTPEAADAAVEAFCAEVHAARERHGIADVVLVAQAQTATGPRACSLMLGAAANRLPLLEAAHRAAVKDLVLASFEAGREEAERTHADGGPDAAR